MNFSIPDTQTLTDKTGSTFAVYNITVNGLSHCLLRYRQLFSFHEQLKKIYGANALPYFPPRKFLLPLTTQEVEERRVQIEKYIQIVGQDPKIVNSELFVSFFLNAQQETKNAKPEDVALDVFLMNGQSVTINVKSTDRSSVVLKAVCRELDLTNLFLPYICLFAASKDNNSSNLKLVRKLQNFEAPYLSVSTLNESCRQNTHRIVVRKFYWDNSYDEHMLADKSALNILYAQTVNDMERGYLQTTKEEKQQLIALQTRGAKRDYVELARPLKYYGYLHFDGCICDHPLPGTPVMISVGGKELLVRSYVTTEQVREFSFRVTRIRCWRLTTTANDQNGKTNGSSSSLSSTTKSLKLELSFEYLMNKDQLKWVTVISDQAILISICLQGIVDELILKRKGIKEPSLPSNNSIHDPRRGSWSYMKRDGSYQKLDKLSRSVSSESGFANGDSDKHNGIKYNARKGSLTKSTRPSFDNNAFDVIGDDDL